MNSEKNALSKPYLVLLIITREVRFPRYCLDSSTPFTDDKYAPELLEFAWNIYGIHIQYIEHVERRKIASESNHGTRVNCATSDEKWYNGTRRSTNRVRIECTRTCWLKEELDFFGLRFNGILNSCRSQNVICIYIYIGKYFY